MRICACQRKFRNSSRRRRSVRLQRLGVAYDYRLVENRLKSEYKTIGVIGRLVFPSISARVVLNAYTEYLKKYGYLEYCPYGSLHSTGMLECEALAFTAENKLEIRENMTMCIDAYFKELE